MATKLVHKKSSVAAKVPLPGDLEAGELALNLADKKIYSKDGGGTIIELSGAAIDDSTTNSVDTWSSTKIAAEVAAAGASTTTTPAPQLSLTSHTGNESTTVDVTIQNYNAVDNVYTVTSDDEALVTVSRSGAVITLTLVDVQWTDGLATSGQATVTVSAFDSANYTYAGTTDIVVTVNRVTVVDATIQVTDFSAALGSSTDVTVENNKPVSDADGAELTSINFAQEGGEENWVKATPSLSLKGKNISSLGNLDTSGLKFYTDDASALSSTTISIWDDDNTLKSYTASQTPVPSLTTGSLTWASTGDADAPDWLLSHESSAKLRSLSPTRDGKYACAYYDVGSTYYWAICSLDVPYSVLGTGTVISSISLSTYNPPAVSHTRHAPSYGGPFNISKDGTKLYVRFTYCGNASYAWLAEYTLTTPYDLTTMSSGVSIVQPIFSTSYAMADFTANVILNDAEDQIITSTGENYDVAGYIIVIEMSTAKDLGSGVVTSWPVTNGSYTFVSFQLAVDGQSLIALRKYDDGASIYVTDRYYIDTADDFTTLTSSGTNVVMSSPGWGNYAGCIVYDPIKNVAFSLQSGAALVSGYSQDIGVSTSGDALYAPPTSLNLTGSAINGTVDFIGPSDLSTPVFHMDVADTEVELDLNGTALSSTSDSGWSFNGTDLVRSIDYAEQVVFGDNLKFKISSMDSGLTIDDVSIILERDQ